MENKTIDRELDWNEEISKASEFILLPDGDYNFTVVSFERASFLYQSGKKSTVKNLL